MAKLVVAALMVLALAGLATATSGDTEPFLFSNLLEHNPWNASVTEIHVVFSSHFDAGCKTPGCGKLVPGEPDMCAYVNPSPPKFGGQGEPFAYHIVNRYFDDFIPRAIEQAKVAAANHSEYSYMIQPWVASLYLDCENSGLVSWPGSPFSKRGIPLLHCPNASAQEEFVNALRDGVMFLNAFPHDGEASYYPDATLFESALAMSKRLAKTIGVSPPKTVSQRDVPGWTRATLPIMAKNGITGLSFGAGTPPGKPDTPPLFVWRDEASGTDMVTTYETGYGHYNGEVFVLPNGHALVPAFAGDNTGPPTSEFVAMALEFLSKTYHGANVHVSTFDSFFKIANEPTNKAKLPVVSKDIGDGWLYGVPSDPTKNAQFRAVARLRHQCLESGPCDIDSPAMQALDRVLVKVPEHTWGVAQMWFLPDYENYTNVQFDTARAQKGFVRNNTVHADYYTTQQSWAEQRAFVTTAPSIVAKAYPEFAKAVASALDDVTQAVAPATAGMQHVASPVGRKFQCGQGSAAVHLTFDAHGAIDTMAVGANQANPGLLVGGGAGGLGTFRYQTFVEDDYKEFLQDFAARINGNCNYTESSSMECSNFRKPNITAANPIRRDIAVTLDSLYHKTQPNGDCSFVAQTSLPEEAHTLAGAPRRVDISINVSSTVITWEVVWMDKRPTRLPESIFFSFAPAADAKSWTMQVLNSTVDPLDQVGSRGVYGGSPHLKGVESLKFVHANGIGMLTSLDVPVVSLGIASPFPTPRDRVADLSGGVHFNIFQNIWNTNYVLWYPFDAVGTNLRTRFRLDFAAS